MFSGSCVLVTALIFFKVAPFPKSLLSSHTTYPMRLFSRTEYFINAIKNIDGLGRDWKTRMSKTRFLRVGRRSRFDSFTCALVAYA